MGNEGSKPGIGQLPLPRMVLIVEAISWPFKHGVSDTDITEDAGVFVVCTLDGREPFGSRALQLPSAPIELLPKRVDAELKLHFFCGPPPEGFAFGLSNMGLNDMKDFPAPSATLSCPISKLARYGAPLYCSMWLGLDDTSDYLFEDNLQDAQRRARVPDAPKVKVTIFKPFGADLANMHPDVIGALSHGENGKDRDSGCVGASIGKPYPYTVQVEGLIRNLDESNHVIRSLQDSLVQSALMKGPVEEVDPRLLEQRRSLVAQHRMREAAHMMKFNKDVKDKDFCLDEERAARAKDANEYAASIERLSAELQTLKGTARCADGLGADLKAANGKFQGELQNRLAAEAKFQTARDSIDKLRVELAEETSSFSELRKKLHGRELELASMQRQHQANQDASTNWLKTSCREREEESSAQKSRMDQEMADAKADFANRLHIQQEQAHIDSENLRRELEALRAELTAAQRAAIDREEQLRGKFEAEMLAAAKAENSKPSLVSKQKCDMLEGRLESSGKKLREAEAALEESKKQGAERLRIEKEKASKQLEALRQKLQADLAARQSELANAVAKLKAAEQAASNWELQLSNEVQDEVKRQVKAAEEEMTILKAAHANEGSARETDAKRLLHLEVQARQLAEHTCDQVEHDLVDSKAEVERRGAQVTELENKMAKQSLLLEESRQALRAALAQAKADHLKEVSAFEEALAAKLKEERDHFAWALDQHDKEAKVSQADLEKCERKASDSKLMEQRLSFESKLADQAAAADLARQEREKQVALKEAELLEKLGSERSRAEKDETAHANLIKVTELENKMAKQSLLLEESRQALRAALAQAKADHLKEVSAFEEALAAKLKEERDHFARALDQHDKEAKVSQADLEKCERKASDSKFMEQRLSFESKLADQAAAADRARQEREKQVALKEAELLEKLGSERSRAEKDATAHANLIKDLKQKQKEAEAELLEEMESTRTEGEEQLKNLMAADEDRLNKLRAEYEELQRAGPAQRPSARPTGFKELEAAQQNAQYWHKKADEEKALKEKSAPRNNQPTGMDSKPNRIILQLFRSLAVEVFSNYTEADMTTLFHKCDRDGSGTVTLSEFSKEIRNGFSLKKSFDMRKAFQKFDLHRSGRITRVEFSAAVQQQLRLDVESVGHIYYLIDSGSRRPGNGSSGQKSRGGAADGCIAEEEFASIFNDPRMGA